MQAIIFIAEEDRRLNTIGNLGSDRRVILISFVSYEGILCIPKLLYRGSSYNAQDGPKNIDVS